MQRTIRMVESLFVCPLVVGTLLIRSHTPVMALRTVHTLLLAHILAVRSSTVHALLLANMLAVRTVHAHLPHLELGLHPTDLEVPQPHSVSLLLNLAELFTALPVHLLRFQSELVLQAHIILIPLNLNLLLFGLKCRLGFYSLLGCVKLLCVTPLQDLVYQL